jgi:hypothetical protein
MVLLIRGKSRCPICGNVIGLDDEVVGTTAFLKKTHRLARFSDAAFHRECFESCPERAEVEQLYLRFEEIMATAPSSSFEEWEHSCKDAMQKFDTDAD